MLNGRTDCTLCRKYWVQYPALDANLKSNLVNTRPAWETEGHKREWGGRS